MSPKRTKIFNPKTVGILLKDSFLAWKEDKAWRLGAALAYFAIFSLAPLLIIIITITSAIYGEQAVRGQIFSEFQGLIGTRGANAVQTLLENAYTSGSGFSATLFGAIMVIFGSTAVFVQLRQAINTIWEIADKPINSIWGFVKARIVAFAMILGSGFLLLISLLMSTLLNIFGNYLGEYFPYFSQIMQVTDFFVSFGFTTVMFALIFKILPNARIKWKDIWIGSAVISFLFTIGKMGISFYLGSSNIASSFGAASSLVIVLLWTFYSAQIFLFGAEFTKIFADRFGGKVLPGEHAVKLKIEKVEPEDSDSSLLY
jgi:membrane protein